MIIPEPIEELRQIRRSVFCILSYCSCLVFCLCGLRSMICKICAGVLKKYEPHMYVGIRSETYPLFGKISYLSAETVYPGIQISLINAGISLGIIILLACLPWKGRPLAIYLILCSAIHLINSLWFVFGEKYFPYTLTVYSKLYMLQEIS